MPRDASLLDSCMSNLCSFFQSGGGTCVHMKAPEFSSSTMRLLITHYMELALELIHCRHDILADKVRPKSSEDWRSQTS